LTNSRAAAAPIGIIASAAIATGRNIFQFSTALKRSVAEIR
jgi:hypothetical protein